MRHRVASVTFTPRTNDGPLDCTCGWSGTVSTWTAHGGRIFEWSDKVSKAVQVARRAEKQAVAA